MRVKGVALVLAAGTAVAAGLACTPTSLKETWTCDFDATEGRPLSDPAAPFDEAGALPASTCMDTCGPPVTACKRTLLDGALPGAICPVCKF
jgi:hypothetical protein